MQTIIQENFEEISALCQLYKVKTLYAFGSVCNDKFTSKSDIDLLVSFYTMDYVDYSDAYFTLADKFEELFQRPVDLITDKSLSNPYFIDALNQTKMLIYG